MDDLKKTSTKLKSTANFGSIIQFHGLEWAIFGLFRVKLPNLDQFQVNIRPINFSRGGYSAISGWFGVVGVDASDGPASQIAKRLKFWGNTLLYYKSISPKFQPPSSSLSFFLVLIH